MQANRFGVALLVALVVGACGGGNTPAGTSSSSGPIHLTVGYSNLSVDFLATWVAKDGGYYEKNGLDVDLQLVSGGSRTMAALLSGQMQFTQQGGAEALSANAGGADVVVLGTLAPVYPYKFMVSPSIKTVDDLKGKKVGISNPGGSSDIATRVALPKMGLDPDKDVEIIAVDSHANRTAALLSGQLLGAVDDPPDSVLLERKGMHSLYDLAGARLPAANTVIAVQRSYLNGHRDVVQKYVDSIVQAINRMKKDKPYTVGILKKYYKSTDDESMNIAYDFFMNSVTPSLPLPKAEQFADAQHYLGLKNARIKGVKIADIIDDSFMKNAGSRGLDK